MKRIIINLIIVCAMVVQAYAQQRQITGTISDQTGESIIGASVVVEGTTRGTITDAGGNFSLDVEGPESVIIISFIGYARQRIEVGNRTHFEITLEATAEALDEVVVVGYGTQQKVSVVGAISSISADELSEIATPNIANSIAGRVPGLIVRHGEGRPGFDDPVISIRGASTINDISPLILIDGMEGDLGGLNPNDIESFSVLKDASATAVYGVRGANGVILITTKRGLEGKPQVFISGQYRLHKLIMYPEFLGSYDYARLYNEASINMGNSPYYTEEDLEHFRTGDSPYSHPDINWLDAATKPFAPEKRVDVNLRGGTESIKYFVAAELLSQDGIYRQWENEAKHSTNARYDRFNLRMNYDFKLTKTTDLGLTMNGRIEDTQNVLYGHSEGYGLWHALLQNRPIDTQLINPDGSIAGSELNDNNAYATLRRGSSYTEKAQSIRGLLNLNQKLDFIMPGLAFRFKAGINSVLDYEYRVVAQEPTYQYHPDTDTYTQIQTGELPVYNISSDHIYKNPYIEAAITFDRRIGEHHFTALALYNEDKKSRNSSPWAAHRGFAGRTTLSLFDKYLGEINIGFNGSTQFEKQERYAFLPAVSAGWIISEEDFFKTLLPYVNYFKIRGSYGTTGNDKIGNYQYLYLSVFERGDLYRFGDAYNEYPGLVESSLANDDVSWEIAKKQNYGFDMRLFDGIRLTFDYFFEKRSNILATRNTLTQILGLQQNQLPPENFGKINNEGFEIAASYRKRFGDFSVQFDGNFSRAKNTIIDIDEVKYDLDYKNQTGKSIGQHFGYLWEGDFYTFEELGYIWDESVEGANKYVLPEGVLPSVPVPTTPVYPGDLKFVDRNDDGIIDNLDIGAVGYTKLPEFIYGFNYTLSYKFITLNMFWQGAGRFTRSFKEVVGLEFYNNSNVNERHLNRWAFYEDPYTGELIDTRATATYPRLVIGGNPEGNKPSNFRHYRADYLRLKNVELSFDLPESLLSAAKIKDAKVYLTGYNLLTFTEQKWVDPEKPEIGAGGSLYPNTGYVGVGINITF